MSVHYKSKLMWFLPKRFDAITLWSTVYIRAETADPKMLKHEECHVKQFAAHPFAFPFMYLWESIRHGYWNNKYEVEARAYADTLQKG